MVPSSRATSTSTVGLPRESKISRAPTASMLAMGAPSTSGWVYDLTLVPPGGGRVWTFGLGQIRPDGSEADHDLLDLVLGVAEQHGRVLAEEQRVLHARV